MQELLNIFIGIFVLVLGIPIGDFLARAAKEEMKAARKYFVPLIIICLIGAVASVIFRDDVLLFTLLFIAIVTSRGLKFNS